MIINGEKSLHHTYVWIQIESYHKSFSIAIAWLDLYPCHFHPVASVSVCANWLLIVYNILLILSRNYMHYNRRPFAFLVEFLNPYNIDKLDSSIFSLFIDHKEFECFWMKGKKRINKTIWKWHKYNNKKCTYTQQITDCHLQNESCARKINNNALCRLQSIP